MRKGRALLDFVLLQEFTKVHLCYFPRQEVAAASILNARFPTKTEVLAF
jgi:hypothetical protein